MKLRDKIAVVTGGASGLGRRTAEYLVQDKAARVAIFDVQDDAGEALVRGLGEDRAVYLRVDVADEAAVAAGVAATVARFGGVDVCVNCAGIPASMKLLDRNREATNGGLFRQAVMVNLVGTFNVMAHCVAAMARNPVADGEERGVVINVASIAAFEGNVGQIGYTASKAGVAGMALPAARELAAIGVRVNTIAPGLFVTPMGEQVSERVRQSLLDMVEWPKRPGDPVEFASLVAYICENAYLNGECIRLDGAARVRRV